MVKKFTYTYLWIIIIAAAVSIDCVPAFAGKKLQQDTTNYLFPKKKTKKSLLPFTLTLPPFKPGMPSTVKLNVPKPDDKLLSAVEVYPNPITDQINLKYIVSRNSNVTIKIVDVLGNNLSTLFSQRVDPGERTFSYPLNNKLNRGFYFIRVMAGTESVIKRISVL